MDKARSSGEVKHINDHGSRQISLETVKKLIEQSQQAKERAYCPYSKFRVGAALLTLDNHVFAGEVHLKFWYESGKEIMFYLISAFS